MGVGGARVGVATGPFRSKTDRRQRAAVFKISFILIVIERAPCTRRKRVPNVVRNDRTVAHDLVELVSHALPAIDADTLVAAVAASVWRRRRVIVTLYVVGDLGHDALASLTTNAILARFFARQRARA